MKLAESLNRPPFPLIEKRIFLLNELPCAGMDPGVGFAGDSVKAKFIPTLIFRFPQYSS